MCFLNAAGFCRPSLELRDGWNDHFVYVASEREGGKLFCLFVIVGADESSSEVLNSTLHSQLNSTEGLRKAQ